MKTILIAKAGKSIDVDFDSLPEVSRNYIIEYGLRQSLNDSTAPLKLTDFKNESAFKEAAWATMEKRLSGILSGELRSVHRESDPVAAEAMRLAKAHVCNKIVAKGLKLKDYKMADITAKAETIVEKFMEQALAVVTARTANKPEIEIEV